VLDAQCLTFGFQLLDLLVHTKSGDEF
jgi:hypothetical protein